MVLPWREFLAARFIGYLLPASAAARLPADQAARFLERLSGRPHQLALLREASVLAPRGAAFERLVRRTLPDLVRALPFRSQVVTRTWEGGYHGRLDVRQTLTAWMTGARSTFVTRSRRRDASLPENVLVRAVVQRLLAVLASQRSSGVLGEAGWGAPYRAWEVPLRHLLATSALREVEVEPISGRHLQAAHHARHPAYGEVVAWHEALREGLDVDDPARIAAVVAAGALAPLAEDRKFELAVVMRLVQALEERLTSGAWSLHLRLLAPGHAEVAELRRDDGARIRVFHNQAVLPPGPAELGAGHYLAQSGRMRPDVTVTVELPGRALRAHVVEVKLSEDPGYVLGGFHEAILYANEYRPALTGWPQAILVASSAVAGEVRTTDPVVAVDWARWPPAPVVEGLCEGC